MYHIIQCKIACKCKIQEINQVPRIGTIFSSGCEGKLGVTLESLQGKYSIKEGIVEYSGQKTKVLSQDTCF